jgi:hypothetical protein
VHTLSGGETFQASLALALTLSRQVVGLSAGMRDVNSMFLETLSIQWQRPSSDSPQTRTAWSGLSRTCPPSLIEFPSSSQSYGIE